MNLAADFALTVAVVILTCTIIWSVQKLVKLGKQRPSLPPGPCGLPIVGYLPFLREDLHHQFTELADKYGPIYKLWIGSKLWTVISSPSLIKEVVRDHDTIFANRDITVAARISSYGFNDIAWSPMALSGATEENYLYEKCLVTPTWRPPAIFVKMRLGKLSKKSIPRFDIQGVAKEITTLLQKVEEITEDTIDERMKNPSNKTEAVEATKDGRTDFLQILIDLMQEEDNKKSLGKTQIKAMLINILAGGTDTSSTTIEWVMAELLCHPNVMEKVQNELDKVVGLNNIVEESHILKLEYLDAVVKETLRLYPLGPLLTPRTPSQSCTVGGYTIPKDSTVFLNVWFVQRDPLIWENPLEFKPERFLNNTKKMDFSGNNFKYLPFGSGRRICAGLPLAERMVRLILASLLHSFKWQLSEGEKLDMSGKLRLTLRKKIPLRAVPIPRLSNIELYE
ncbi:UNVERIFIED_CONTAM: Flavonoid 3'-monooxygenase [Sesamum angustifolium]|uniref:Flavonoid 3'-monooxygenase n=1 Tax=Sesamum angustifolium TaxID=2727405 RepID=A0AAW2MLT1_9LAMI